VEGPAFRTPHILCRLTAELALSDQAQRESNTSLDFRIIRLANDCSARDDVSQEARQVWPTAEGRRRTTADDFLGNTLFQFFQAAIIPSFKKKVGISINLVCLLGWIFG